LGRRGVRTAGDAGGLGMVAVGCMKFDR